MIARLKKYWGNTKEMPFLLGMFCQGGMVAAPILLLSIFLPGQEWDVNGHPMEFAKFWRSGAATSALFLAGLGTIGAWGLAARKPWSRWAWVAAPVLPLITFPRELVPDLAMAVLSGRVSAAIIYVCLFRLGSVRAYLNSGANNEQSAA